MPIDSPVGPVMAYLDLLDMERPGLSLPVALAMQNPRLLPVLLRVLSAVRLLLPMPRSQFMQMPDFPEPHVVQRPRLLPVLLCVSLVI